MRPTPAFALAFELAEFSQRGGTVTIDQPDDHGDGYAVRIDYAGQRYRYSNESIDIARARGFLAEWQRIWQQTDRATAADGDGRYGVAEIESEDD
jgi:hypothetical protein